MKLFAISGGIATGKSTALKILNDLGYTTINCDQLALEAYHKKHDVIKQVIGTKILEDNQISRKKLIHYFFTDVNVKNKIEAIIHPCVKYELIKLIIFYFLTNKRVVFVEIPLFFELKFDKYIDTILIDCNETLQKKRLLQRDGGLILEEKIASQMHMQEKRKLAGIIIKNEESLAELKDKLEKINISGTGLYEYAIILIFFVLLCIMSYNK